MSSTESLTLEIDGCFTDSQGTQHYTFPREAFGDCSETYLAICENQWHLHPEWQGQWEEGREEVEVDYELLFTAVDSIVANSQANDSEGIWVEKDGLYRSAFPRDLIWDGVDDDVLAFLEWQWHCGAIASHEFISSFVLAQ